MRHTQNSTEDLVASVRQIAISSAKQVLITKKLQNDTVQILESNKQTSTQLKEQTIQTKRLVDYAKGLLKAVQVFKLPGVAPAEIVKPVNKTVETHAEFVAPSEQKKAS